MALGKIIATHYSPTEFGRYFIFANIVSLYASVLTTPIIQAYRHFYYREEGAGLLAFYRSLLIWIFVLILFCIILGGLVKWVPWWIGGLLLSHIFFQNHSALHINHINIRGKTILQSLVQLSLPVLSILLILLSVRFLNGGSFGDLWTANIISEGLVMMLGLVVFIPHRSIKIKSLYATIHSPHFKKLVSFAKPILALPLFVWMVNNLDKWLLDWFYTKREVGIYAAAAGIGSKMFLLMSGTIISYYNASMYQKAQDLDQREELIRETHKRVMLYIGLGVGLVLIVFFLRSWIGRLLLSVNYVESFDLIPLLALAYLVFSSIVFYEQVIYAVGRTRLILVHYGFGALINVTLNFLLIPKWGVWGAGISMVITACLQLLVVYWLFRNKLTLSHSTE